MGSVAIVKFSDKEAQLRWLLLDPEMRGMGLGRRLVEEALAFCREAGYSSMFLWTVKTLTTAIKLYQSLGFIERDEQTHELWGYRGKVRSIAELLIREPLLSTIICGYDAITFNTTLTSFNLRMPALSMDFDPPSPVSLVIQCLVDPM